MSRFDKGRMGDNSGKTMIEAVDEQLDILAGLIVGFLNAVDNEEELYLLVEKLCEYDDLILEKLSRQFRLRRAIWLSYTNACQKLYQKHTKTRIIRVH